MKYLIFLFSFFLMSSTINFHQDTPLKIDENDNIIGLPKQFYPAKFDKEAYKLRIGINQIELPFCINRYFKIFDDSKLYLSASWYHSKEIMPYYLNFNILDKGENNRYNILINLETLELIYVDAPADEEDIYISRRLKIKDDCIKEYKSNIILIE